MYFEGPEKKLEIILDSNIPSLRTKSRDFWDMIVKQAGAQILSCVSNSFCDAYLLSESSLFVYNHRLTMITCGKTTLVDTCTTLIKEFGLKNIVHMFYERKNQHFPEWQPSHFYDDSKFLNSLLKGKAYRFGEEDDHHLYLYHMNSKTLPPPEDATLEILMHGIDEKAASIFSKGPHHTKDFVKDESGVWDIFEGFQVDDYIFEPVGYSLNAIKDQNYYTIHVTPQKIGSYVSFETNYIKGDLQSNSSTIYKVLDIFKPRSVDLVFFSPQPHKNIEIDNYHLKRQYHQKLNCGFEVSFCHYFRPETQVFSAYELNV